MSDYNGYITCPNCSESIRLGAFRRGQLLDSPGAVLQAFQALVLLQHEEFWVALLDAKLHVIGRHKVAEGTLAACIVHPRDVFAPAISQSAHSIMLIHNHPSGNPEPSDDDRALTRRLVQAGDVMNVRVLDHVIVATDGYYSFGNNGIFR